ncbi:MAG: glutamyl-tRNA reductase [bacterium]
MKIIIVGLSHKTAPIEARERLSFPETKIKDCLITLQGKEHVKECVIISTCNRVEILAVVDDNISNGIQTIQKFLMEYSNLELKEIEKYLYKYLDNEAILHILRVACSLDSMVVGEPQILGQVKNAYEYACEAKTVGTILHNLMNKSFKIAKKVRTETKLGENAVSISFAAIELAKKIFDNLCDKTVMIIGAGEMGELAVKHLISSGIKSVIVSNRTYSRAQNLADEFKGEAVRFDKLIEELPKADIVISSTGAPHLVIHKKDIEDVMIKRKNNPIFFIDIALPRDIDPAVNGLDNVYLYDIDDLQSVVASNITERQKEVHKAEEIIKKELNKFHKWIQDRNLVPLIIDLRKQIVDVCETEAQKLFSRLPALEDEEKEAILLMANSIANKIAHKPTTVLKKHAASEGSEDYVKVIRSLF